MTSPTTDPRGPRIVAIGGGHGLAVTLRALRDRARCITAVVSTADDGGSTGRLRESWDVPALGDVRRCLAALAADERHAGTHGEVWARVLERRFDDGELRGHALGNLLLLALTEELGDLQSACDAVAVGAGIDLRRARVVPVTDDAVVLHATTRSGDQVEGQVAVARTAGLEEVWVAPRSTAASAVALNAIARADLVVLGPGSLYTSVLAAAVVGDLRQALATTSARVVYVGNLRAEGTETGGYDLSDHLAALSRHGVAPHLAVAHTDTTLGACAVPVVSAPLAAADGWAHDPDLLGDVLLDLVG